MTTNTKIKSLADIPTWRQRLRPDGSFDTGTGFNPTGASAMLASRDAELTDLRAYAERLESEQSRMIDKIAELHQRAAALVSQPVGAVVADEILKILAGQKAEAKTHDGDWWRGYEAALYWISKAISDNQKDES